MLSAMSVLTWNRMKTLIAVADVGSVHAAAVALHVTEPAVSASIAGLEKHLGAKLLARAGRGIRLTEAAEVLVEYCRTIVGLMDEAQIAVNQPDKGKIRIGAVSTASEYVLPRLLVSFRRRHPTSDLSLSVHPRDELFEQLRHHEIDLVIAGRPPEASDLVSRAQRANRLVVVGAPDRTGSTQGDTWLLRGTGSGTRDTTLSLFNQLQIEPPTLMLGTHGAVVAAARAGLGVTLVHEDAVEDEITRGTLSLVPLARTPVNRPWHITTTATPTPSSLLFIRHVTDRRLLGATAFHLRNRPSG